MHLKSIFLAAALLTMPVVAQAHDVAKGPNGGQIVDDAGHHVEFTVKDGAIILFLSDNVDAPIGSAKATGRVIVQDGGKQATVELTSAEPNILGAKLGAPLSQGAKLAVTIKPATVTM
jgi:hypothetical protein